MEGEQVEFRLGNAVLGTTVGTAEITLLDIINEPNLDSAYSQNIATILELLDEDNNVANGIQIPDNGLEALGLDPNTDLTEDVTGLLAEIALQESLSTGNYVPVPSTVQSSQRLADALGIPFDETTNLVCRKILSFYEGILCNTINAI